MKNKIIAILITISTTVITAFGAAGCSKRTDKALNKTDNVAEETDTKETTEIETESANKTPGGTSAYEIETETYKISETETESESLKVTVPTKGDADIEVVTTTTEVVAQTEEPSKALTTAPVVEVTTQESTTPVKQEKPTEKVTEAPTAAPKPTVAPKPTEEPTTKEKTIWDYPFDIEAIKAQLIAWGEEIGLKHVTEYEGWGLATPQNSSYDLPAFICKGWEGDRAKNYLKEWVVTEPESLKGAGFDFDLEYFTIWIEERENGSYQIYLLF